MNNLKNNSIYLLGGLFELLFMKFEKYNLVLLSVK